MQRLNYDRKFSLGIVASLAPGVILPLGYALFGGSANLLGGPRAAVSLVFAATLSSLLAMDSIYEAGADRASAALTLALIMAGAPERAAK